MKTLRSIAQNMSSKTPISIRELSKKVSWNEPDPIIQISLRKLIEHGSVTKYYISLTSINVAETRSLSKDTVHINFYLEINGRSYEPKYLYLGDIGEGTYDLREHPNYNLYFGPIPIEDPETIISFLYQIMNIGGSVTAETVKATLNNSATVLSHTATATSLVAPSAGGILDMISGGWSLVTSIINLVWALCDGPLAVDLIKITEKELRNFIAEKGENDSAQQTREYPGTDSNTGCGSNSKYFVTYEVIRTW